MTFQHDNLRTLMALKSLTSQEVAAFVGVSPVTVSNWRVGRSAPQARYLVPLAEVMKVEIPFFFGKINVLIGSENV